MSAYEIEMVNVRLVREPSLYSEKPITNSSDVLQVVANELKQYDREVFGILNLKTNGQVINFNICSVGTLNSSLVSPKDIMKSAILSNAAGFIAIHNHPSGSCDPSSCDIETTKRLVECGKLLDIKMIDHIIIAGETGVTLSMMAEGLVQF